MHAGAKRAPLPEEAALGTRRPPTGVRCTSEGTPGRSGSIGAESGGDESKVAEIPN